MEKSQNKEGGKIELRSYLCYYNCIQKEQPGLFSVRLQIARRKKYDPDPEKDRVDADLYIFTILFSWTSKISPPPDIFDIREQIDWGHEFVRMEN